MCLFVAKLFLSDLHWKRHASETVDALQPILIKLLVDDAVMT